MNRSEILWLNGQLKCLLTTGRATKTRRTITNGSFFAKHQGTPIFTTVFAANGDGTAMKSHLATTKIRAGKINHENEPTLTYLASGTATGPDEAFSGKENEMSASEVKSAVFVP